MKRAAALILCAAFAASLIVGCSSNKPTHNDQASRMQHKQLPTTYTLQPGDTLKSVAKKFYGSEDKWMAIYRANVEKLPSADAIEVGLKLTIPPKAAVMNAHQKMNQGSSNMKSNSDKGDMSSDHMQGNNAPAATNNASADQGDQGDQGDADQGDMDNNDGGM